jgi:hypothetical protein
VLLTQYRCAHSRAEAGLDAVGDWELSYGPISNEVAKASPRVLDELERRRHAAVG